MDRKRFGTYGELLAEVYLEEQGYQLQAKNYQCRLGEVDLIAEKDGCLHFVEVKTRKQNDAFRPAEAVNRTKQEHLWKAAQVYLKEVGKEYDAICFDVMEVEVNHLVNVL